MKYFTSILVIIALSFTSCTDQKNPDFVSNVDELNTLKVELKKLRSPQLMHTVYVWLKEDLSEEDFYSFLKDTEDLGNIKSVARLRIGKPAKTENRDVVDHSFTYAMNIEFDSIEDQNAYQVDPIHLKFVENNKDKWEKIIVYDNTMQ